MARTEPEQDQRLQTGIAVSDGLVGYWPGRRATPKARRSLDPCAAVLSESVPETGPSRAPCQAAINLVYTLKGGVDISHSGNVAAVSRNPNQLDLFAVGNQGDVTPLVDSWE
jgi:hypothetical protein